MSKKMIEISGSIQNENLLSILFFDGHISEWLPKSQIEYDGDVGDDVDILMPEWLAYRKGFI
jgi:hypothetical protein